MIIEAQLTFFFFLNNSVVYHLTIDKILYLLEFSVELNISKREAVKIKKLTPTRTIQILSISLGYSAVMPLNNGLAGWALAHPEFGSSVNPITTRGADYAHHITASPPGFENPAASLQCVITHCSLGAIQ